MHKNFVQIFGMNCYYLHVDQYPHLCCDYNNKDKDDSPHKNKIKLNFVVNLYFFFI